MRSIQVLAGFAVLFALLGAVAGCDDDKPPVFPPDSGVLTVAYLASTPDTTDIINDDDAWTAAEELSIQVGTKEAYTDQFGAIVVRAKAVSDNQSVFFRFEWRDPTKSELPAYWLHQIGSSCAVWLQNADSSCFEVNNPLSPKLTNEDILGLFIDNGSNGTEGADCATMCHDDTIMTLTGGGAVDAWVWRAGRTAPLGLADDQKWMSGDFDPDHRPDAFGVKAWDLNGNGEPDFQHQDGSSYHGSFLFIDDAVALDFNAWDSDTSLGGIPGYTLNRNWAQGIAATSRYDVKSASNYDEISQRWTIVLWRELDTGETDDFALSAGAEYEASVAVMDHTNQRHSGSEPFKIKF